MHPPRLFVSQTLFPDATLTLTGNPAHYLSHVLRRKPGDAVCLFNAVDGEWEGQIFKVSKKSVDLKLGLRLRPPEPPSHHLSLLFAPLKSHRLEMLVEKGTELGATHFIPCQTAHTHVRHINWGRLEAIAREATEQSGRLTPPQFTPFGSLEKHLSAWPAESPLFYGDLDACGQGWDPLQELRFAASLSSSIPQVGLLIGPEGGWHEAEKNLLAQHPATRPLWLGPTTLRAETAALVGLGLLSVALSQPVLKN